MCDFAIVVCHASSTHCIHSCAEGCLQNDGIGKSELQRLAAEAHRAAREVGLKDIMAANESGGVTRDSLRKAHPLAVKAGPALFLNR